MGDHIVSVARDGANGQKKRLSGDFKGVGRTILLIVSGLSPQVVTETLYALWVSDPSTMPDEIHLLTTAAGAERAELTLLSEDPGWLARLWEEYAIPLVPFSSDSIHILHDRNGHPLDDIRSVEDIELAADRIMQVVRDFTADSSVRLHISLAGGRKTMGFFAGYALSLFGRSQDRLSHVLVSSPFESHPQFFFPTLRPRVIYSTGPDRRPLDTRSAEVTLADIPFIRMRDLLDPTLLQGDASYSETVARTRAVIEAPVLTIDITERRVFCGGRSVVMSRGNLAFYLWMAQRSLTGCDPVRWDDDIDEEELVCCYQMVAGELSARLDQIRKIVGDGMDAGFFQRHISRINRSLRDALGPGPARPYLIVTSGSRPKTRYHLPLASRQIVIRGARDVGSDVLSNEPPTCIS